MKKGVSLILALVMVFGMLPLNVFATGTEVLCIDGHSYGEWTVIDEDTRQRVCNVCGESKIFGRMDMPSYYNGEVHVENNPNGVYYGTRNVADLLELKSGTYINGEVTIYIDGTEIAVSGTPAKTLYFDLQTGEFGTPDYLRDPGYDLPDGDYRFGLIGSGSVFPTACIRTPNGKENQVATAGVLSATELSGANFGVPYLYLPKDKNYDFSGQLILNMGTDKTYDGDMAKTKKIEGNGDFTVSGYLWAPSLDTDVFAELPSHDVGKLTYIGGNKEYINIYLPREVGYLQVQMNLENNSSTNAYGWRLNMMYACDNNLKQIFPVTSSGEYEAAIKLSDRPDFMGMGAHGSEQMTSFTMYVDKVEVELAQLAAMTDWKSIKIVRESDFYDPLDETTVVATHTVVYEFDLEGLTVTQDVEWLVDATCTTSYMMMFPVRRDYKNLQVTDTYFDDYDATEYDVSKPGFTGYPVNWTRGATKMTLYSEKSGITASMESLETPILTGTSYYKCANNESYNKLYFTICGGGGTKHQVTSRDRWHTQHRYEVTISQGTDVDNPCVFGHRYTAKVTAPTCTQQGYTTYTCACGDSYVADFVEASGHNYADEKCQQCGNPWPEKLIHFSFDDTIGALKELTENADKYQSLFDQPFFKALKDLHDTYGAVFSLYCFYNLVDSTDKTTVLFSLEDCTDRYAAEFTQNAGWLRLGFHSVDNVTNYANTNATEAKNDYDRMIEQILRITGTDKSVDTCVRLQNFAGNLSSCRAIHDCKYGITGLLTSDYAEASSSDVYYASGYYLIEPATTIIASKGEYYDTSEGLVFYPSNLRLDNISSAAVPAYMDTFLSEAKKDRNKIIIMYAHENQMYKNGEVNTDYIKRLSFACDWALENGYGFAFPMDRAIQTEEPPVEETPNDVEVKFFTNNGYLSITDGAVAKPESTWVHSDLLSLEDLANDSTGICASKLIGHSYVANIAYYADSDFCTWISSLGSTTGFSGTPAVTVEFVRQNAPEGAKYVAFSTNGESNTLAVALKVSHTHTYTHAVTAPTCTQQGYTTYTCTCGDSYVDDYVDATGHAYENGICTACGAEDSGYVLYGDLDQDGEVTDWDAILLNRYLAGWKVTVDLKAADIDQDGEATDWDGILLDRYLAGWNIDL